MDARSALLTIGFALLGAVVAWTYCALVRYSVRLLGRGRSRLPRFLALVVVRIALVAGGFYGASCLGIWPVAGYTAGFFIARTVVLSRAHADTVAATRPDEMKQVNG